jgi:hypothetical protein
MMSCWKSYLRRRIQLGKCLKTNVFKYA